MIRPRRFCLLLLIASGAWSAIHVEIAVAQASGPENPRFEVVLNNVYPPVYPPLADGKNHGGCEDSSSHSERR
jgi:hypothetical protein